MTYHYFITFHRWIAGDLAHYDNETAARTILKGFFEAEEEKLKDIQVKDNKPTLYDFISDGLKNKKYFHTLDNLFSIFDREELK